VPMVVPCQADDGGRTGSFRKLVRCPTIPLGGCHRCGWDKGQGARQVHLFLNNSSIIVLLNS
jgi:hypothetical protein